MTGVLNEWSTLASVALRDPKTAFASAGRVSEQWQQLGYRARPDFKTAIAEYDRLIAVIEDHGAEITFLPGGDALTLDSLYVRDATMVSTDGLIATRMGKPPRRAEPDTALAALSATGHAIAGRIEAPALLEGGDLVWLDDETLLAGRGWRTNQAGIDALRALLGPKVTVHGFDLPHYRGAGDVFHLMSVLSPVGHDLAVVYPPLMPVGLVQLLQERGIGLIEVPEAEFVRMGCNVLALGPRNVVMVEGHRETRAGLERAGAKVIEIKGDEICLKGDGGPTCLTRPLRRIRSETT